MTQDPPSSTALALPGAEPAHGSALAIVPAPKNVNDGHTTRFRIPGDLVNEVTRDLPDEHREAVRWLYGHCKQKDLGEEAIGELLLVNPDKSNSRFYDANSIRQLLTGKRMKDGVNIEPMVKSIQALRKKVDSVSRVGDSGFIQTRLSKTMTDRYDRARSLHKILFVWGDSQIGKTETAVEYTRTHNHGNTVYFEVPTGGSLLMFLEGLAEKLNIPQQQRLANLRTRIIKSFDRKMLLIVDEAHRCLHTNSGIQSLDFLRELYNKAGCGIVLQMTNEGRRLFLKGPHAEALKQLWRRRIAPLQLPAMLPPDDLAAFAIGYGLTPAPDKDFTLNTPYLDGDGKEQMRQFKVRPLELQERVNREEGLGVWLQILKDAKDTAKADGDRKLTWGAVLKAYCMMQSDEEAWS